MVGKNSGRKWQSIICCFKIKYEVMLCLNIQLKPEIIVVNNLLIGLCAHPYLS